MSTAIPVAEAASLPPGSHRTVECNGHRIALFNLEGSFHAIDDACPHRGASLAEGWCEGGQVLCPLHGWAFDVRSGQCLTRPDRPVASYQAEVRDGRVWVVLPPQAASE